MSTSTASNRRSGMAGSKPDSRDIVKKSPSSNRHRGSAVNTRPSGTSSWRCQLITGARASTTISCRTRVVGHHRVRRVAQTETADHDVPAVDRVPPTLQPTEREVRQGDLCDREQAGHQVLIAELDLEDVLAGAQVLATSQAHLPDRGRLPRQLLEPSAHRSRPSRGTRIESRPAGQSNTTGQGWFNWTAPVDLVGETVPGSRVQPA